MSCRHCTLRVRRVRRVGRRLRRVAVAAQVRADDGVCGGERRRDPVPHRVRLRIAVQHAAAAARCRRRRNGFRRRTCERAVPRIPETVRPRSLAARQRRSVDFIAVGSRRSFALASRMRSMPTDSRGGDEVGPRRCRRMAMPFASRAARVCARYRRAPAPACPARRAATP